MYKYGWIGTFKDGSAGHWYSIGEKTYERCLKMVEVEMHCDEEDDNIVEIQYFICEV